MARYQLRRPSPVKVFPRYVRRQEAPAAGAEEEGPKSPESPPGSSPSTVGSSEADDSESEDEAAEPPSPTGNVAPAPPPPPPERATLTSAAVIASSTLQAQTSQTSFQTIALPPAPSAEAETSTSTSSSSVTTASSLAASSSPPASSNAPSSTPLVTSAAPPAFTAVISSQGNNAALPQITGVESNTTTTTPSSVSASIIVETSLSLEPSVTIPTTSSALESSSPFPSPATPPPSITLTFPTPAQSETSGDNSSPQRSFPRPEPPILTKGAAVAAIVLGVLGALALIIAAVVFIKRRKRRRNAYNQRLGDDAFSPGNTGSLRAPETAHLDSNFTFLNGSSSNSFAHQTRSTERSDTLFGAGSYSRPETASTDRNNSRITGRPPTANPFADPPLNKAYDVLGGRPRSTTLTDRGSWVKNPFRNPESERFDPFGELQAKAQRARHIDEARREAELIKEYEQREREFAAKERMGLAPDGLPMRKGSNVTIEGLGVLDRTSGSFYR